MCKSISCEKWDSVQKPVPNLIQDGGPTAQRRKTAHPMFPNACRKLGKIKKSLSSTTVPVMNILSATSNNHCQQVPAFKQSNFYLISHLKLGYRQNWHIITAKIQEKIKKRKKKSTELFQYFLRENEKDTTVFHNVSAITV